ncbi:hypothetical protein KR222_002143 [Zaprionus bogoriensis]|nr:hypothetical protein KR222_002143 [Zaprionus bogoriensis]
MILATVTNYEQHLQILRSITSRGHLLGLEKFWLGGTNLVDYTTWYWLNRGIPFGYRKWAKDEPQSNLYGTQGCLVMGLDNDWHSEDCGDEYFFICESACNTNLTLEPLYI